MQLKNKLGFEKQLGMLNRASLPQVFLIACPDAFEKTSVLKKCRQRAQELQVDFTLEELDASQVNPEEIYALAKSLSLFSEKRAFLIEACDSLKKASLQALTQVIQRAAESERKDLYFFLGFASYKGSSELIDKCKKHLLMLDLTGEKPWEKEKRLTEEAYFYLSKAGKKINQIAAKELVLATGKDPANLANSLEKIICLIGDRPEVTLEDITANFAKFETKTIWQMGQQIVWGQELPDTSAFSTQDFLGLLHPLRTHLQLGAHLAQMDTIYEISTIVADYPYVKPAEMQKYFSLAKDKGSLHYLKGLHDLLHFEVAVKSVPVPEGLLFDQFYLRWQHGS